MSAINSQLNDALIETLTELFNAEDEEHAQGLIALIIEVRGDMNLIMMSDQYVEANIWNKIRTKTSNVQTLMSTTATFIQQIDDIDTAIKRFVRSAVPFTSATQIVDHETITKAVDHSELERVLTCNLWLFFLLYSSTNMRVVNAYLATLAPPGKGGNRK